METIFPEEPGVAGGFLIGWRRRLGSGVSGDNIEQTATVILKRAYTVDASDSDPALGSLTPAAGAAELFEGDRPGEILPNGDFSDGLSGWSETGGASATLLDGAVRVSRSGAGDIRASVTFSRQLRERGFGLSVKASAAEGLAKPEPRIVAGGETGARAADPPGPFPEPDQQPVTLSGYDRFSGGVTTAALSVRLPAMAADGQEVTYREASVTTVEYESDLVPFKPEADLIVIADGPPLPLAIRVNGTLRMSQEALAPPELTGLGWEERVGTPREGEAGDLEAMTQALPDDFRNRFFNGYRRDRRVGASVPHLEPGDEVELTRAGDVAYGFTLPATVPVLRHEWFTGEGQDDPCLWRAREVTMRLDTLVIEPDRDLAYAVWRAIWPLAFDPDGSGPVPLGNNRRITVRLEEG